MKMLAAFFPVIVVALGLCACGGGGSPQGSTKSATLVSITLSPTNPSLDFGAAIQFTATGTYSDSTTKDLTSSVTWSSTNSGIASINTTGLVTPVAVGPTTIKATLVDTQAIPGTISGSTSMTVGYSITNIVRGTYGKATDINYSGQIVGITNAWGADSAFLYSGGAMTNLGTLRGSAFSGAYGINDFGQVVGGTGSDVIDGVIHAFLYSGGVMTDLGTLGGGGSSGAYDINNSGQIVGGSSITYNSVEHAFLYSGGAMTDLGTLGGSYIYSRASRINNSGQVVGISYTLSGVFHAFLYSGGVMTDLGTLGGSYINSHATGINDSGQVVGWSSTTDNGVSHAFLYSGGAMTDLGTLGGINSRAFGINNSGQVVGWSSTTDNASSHAFLYSGGVMIDLNNLVNPVLGWTLTDAAAINDSGQIVCNGQVNGESHVFIITIF